MDTVSIAELFLDSILQAMTNVWFIVLPPTLYWLFKVLWLDFVHNKYLSKIKWTMLEIIPPSDIEETPQAMEMIYSGLLGSMKGINAIEENVIGEIPVSFSLELVSTEGEIHFYIRTPENFQDLVETHIHAQYPTAEVLAVDDYVDNIPKVIPSKTWTLWGTDLILDKADPYPIKTYRWFQEDVTGKALDPLASVLEGIGKIGPSQHFWLQLVITPKDYSEYDSGRKLADELAGRETPNEEFFIEKFFKGILSFIGDIISALIGGLPEGGGASNSDEQRVDPIESKLTPGERDVLKMIEEGIGKSAFNVKMRLVYAGKKESFNMGIIGSIFGALKQFSDINLNGFRPDGDSKTYALHLFAESRKKYRQRKILRRYRDRDTDGHTFHLNTEELATIFHLPNMSVMTPALHQVETKVSSAPINLPIEDSE